MEKIACVLWKPAGVPDDVFGKGLRGAAPELARLGAANLHLNVVDEHVAAGTGARVALEEVMRRLPEYEIDEAKAVRNRTEFVRGWLSLPARFTPA